MSHFLDKDCQTQPATITRPVHDFISRVLLVDPPATTNQYSQLDMVERKLAVTSLLALLNTDPQLWQVVVQQVQGSLPRAPLPTANTPQVPPYSSPIHNGRPTVAEDGINDPPPSSPPSLPKRSAVPQSFKGAPAPI